ncbi:MAG: Type 1 glutamine amidotransferase-like domain-containing protein [Gaiellaceae bacterium]
MPAGHIVALGGGGFMFEDVSPLDDFVLSLARAPRPRICFLGTASGDSPSWLDAFFDAFGRRDCEPSHLRLFGAPTDPSRQLRRQDVIYVGGGNTANMLAVWRVHGVDRALREAWGRGSVLAGVSAGANSWFEASVTDSFGPRLGPLRDGLALLPGSFCPHYDTEARRRPVFRELARNGFPPGYAADDCAALWFEGTKLRRVVASRACARVYKVDADEEVPIEAELLA